MIMLAVLCVCVVLPTMVAAAAGGPIIGMLMGLVTGWIVVYRWAGYSEGSFIASGAAGFCGGLASWKLGGLLGAAAGAGVTFTAFILIFMILVKIGSK